MFFVYSLLVHLGCWVELLFALFTMAARQAEPYDHLFKLLLVGDAAVGKSRHVSMF